MLTKNEVDGSLLPLSLCTLSWLSLCKQSSWHLIKTLKTTIHGLSISIYVLHESHVYAHIIMSNSSPQFFKALTTSSDESFFQTAASSFHTNTQISCTSSIPAALACWVTRLVCDAYRRAWRTQAFPQRTLSLIRQRRRAARISHCQSDLKLKETFSRLNWEPSSCLSVLAKLLPVEVQVRQMSWHIMIRVDRAAKGTKIMCFSNFCNHVCVCFCVYVSSCQLELWVTLLCHLFCCLHRN